MITHTVVTTFDGSTAFRKDCRFIKGEHYVKNKQCFLINDTWYRINSGLIAYDYETKTWVVIKESPSLKKGIVSFDRVTRQATMGYYTTNPYRNVTIILQNGNAVDCFDYSVIPADLFREDKAGGDFVHKDYTGFRQNKVVVFANNAYPFPLQYCLKHYEDGFRKEFEDAVEKKVFLGNSLKISEYANVLSDMTFGLEFETATGKIPNYKIKESGLVPLRDGSITGIEFATVVLQGKRGVKMIEEICKNLTDYTTITTNESLHLHIGGFASSKKMIGYLYTLCCILETDVYSIFPQYYSKTSLFKPKAKDYNMPLRRELVTSDPEETFNNIAYYLGAGKKYQGFGANHPSDPNGDHKWGINERYHWVNFIPTLFGSNKTVEFRCHVPTRDPIKVINWLYICAAIIKLAKSLSDKNADMTQYTSYNLRKVIDNVYSGKLAIYLNNYVEERKAARINDVSKGDAIGTREVSEEMKGKQRFSDMQ